MKPSQVPWMKINSGRRAHYRTFSGFGVYPDGLLPGSIVEPEEHSLLPSDRLVVVPHVTQDDFGTGDVVESCDFCSYPGLVAERGILPADYELHDEYLNEVVAHTCHACIAEVPVVEYNADEWDPDNVFLERDQ